MRDATGECLVRGVVRQMLDAEAAPGERPCYAVEVERLAAAWYMAGIPLPDDYDNPDGRPSAPADREYARARGKGDGRRNTDLFTASRMAGGLAGPFAHFAS